MLVYSGFLWSTIGIPTNQSTGMEGLEHIRALLMSHETDMTHGDDRDAWCTSDIIFQIIWQIWHHLCCNLTSSPSGDGFDSCRLMDLDRCFGKRMGSAPNTVTCVWRIKEYKESESETTDFFRNFSDIIDAMKNWELLLSTSSSWKAKAAGIFKVCWNCTNLQTEHGSSVCCVICVLSKTYCSTCFCTAKDLSDFGSVAFFAVSLVSTS